MVSALKTMFARPALRRLAGPRSFERGLHYAWDRRTKKLRVEDEEVTAVVRGTHDYRVRLWIEEGKPGFECTCPMGDAGNFCKHCVAVGLVLADEQTELYSDRAPTTADLRAYLRTRDKDALVDLLLDRAAEDEFLRGRLGLEAAKSSGVEVNLDAYRQAIDDTMVVHDFVGYREMYDYSQNVDEAIGSIRDLLEAGHAEEVITLCEYALEAMEDAWGRVDDSDGSMGGSRDELVELHHDACFQGNPDPVALAERLFHWELYSEWETFYGAAEEYQDVLGPEGLATYRALAKEVWARVPNRGGDDERDFSTFRFRITQIMEALARTSGDVDQLVAVKARDLSSAYHLVEIAEILRDAGRHDEALEWAERGLAAFPDHRHAPTRAHRRRIPPPRSSRRRHGLDLDDLLGTTQPRHLPAPPPPRNDRGHMGRVAQEGPRSPAGSDQSSQGRRDPSESVGEAGRPLQPRRGVPLGGRRRRGMGGGQGGRVLQRPMDASRRCPRGRLPRRRTPHLPGSRRAYDPGEEKRGLRRCG